MTEPIPDSEFVEPPLFATADDVQFWEPWTANSPLMRPTPAGSFVSRADFDRLRDERDRAIEQRENANRASVRVELELARLRTERDELRRAVGRDRSTPSGGGQPDARGDGTERHHDTLTEEKTDG